MRLSSATIRCQQMYVKSETVFSKMFCSCNLTLACLKDSECEHVERKIGSYHNTPGRGIVNRRLICMAWVICPHAYQIAEHDQDRVKLYLEAHSPEAPIPCHCPFVIDKIDLVEEKLFCCISCVWQSRKYCCYFGSLKSCVGHGPPCR